MSPARLSIFFGRLATDLQRGPAGASDLSEHLSRAVSCSGGRKLRELFAGKLADENGADGTGLAAKMRANARAFGKLESEVLAEAIEERSLGEAADRAAAHYDRVARADGLAVQAAVVPLLSLVAMLAIAALLSVFVLPRFAQALRELGIPMPFVTRGVVYGAVLFKVIVSPLLVSGGLLVLVLVLYWRTLEGRARLERVLLRLPLVGELYALWVGLRFSGSAVLCHQLGWEASEAVSKAAAGLPCESLRAAMSEERDHVGHRVFVSLRSAVDHGAGSLSTDLLAERELLEQRLALLSRQVVLATQVVLILFAIGICAAAVWGTYLPIAHFHDSVMR